MYGFSSNIVVYLVIDKFQNTNLFAKIYIYFYTKMDIFYKSKGYVIIVK